jgi:hypothetical protein
MNEVYLLTLSYETYFDDADAGPCYAGMGSRLISAHQNRATAEAIVAEFNPVFAQAELERIIFPIQAASKLLKNRFGFTVHDIDAGRNFKLVVETLAVEP